MGAIGALMSPNPITRQHAEEFSAAARKILFESGLQTPHITTVQSLLCCAFYELGKGEFSNGWLYSGKSYKYVAHEPEY